MTKFELELNGKKLSFNIGLRFLGEYQEKYELDINELIQKIDRNPWKVIPSLMYESCLVANRKLDFTEDDLIDWIDEDGGFSCNAFTEFLELFINSLTKNVPVEDEVIEEKGAKKK